MISFQSDCRIKIPNYRAAETQPGSCLGSCYITVILSGKKLKVRLQHESAMEIASWYFLQGDCKSNQIIT